MGAKERRSEKPVGICTESDCESTAKWLIMGQEGMHLCDVHYLAWKKAKRIEQYPDDPVPTELE